MSAQEPEKSLIRIKQPLKVLCHIWYSAPYSLSEEVTLIEGMILRLHHYKDKDESVRYEASPVNHKIWAPFLISTDYRNDKNFNYGYNFYLNEDDLEHCETITEVPEEKVLPEKLYQSFQGCLFGTAAGDAIGLPFEGISARRIKKFKAFPLRQRFINGKGMLSDDTEHTCIVAHALIFSINDLKEFSNNLCWSLRFWLLGLPAGIGMATLKACLKLWLFISPEKSGVFSAGNGPAMRSALIGVYANDDETLRKDLLTINTRITHTDPKALRGASIVAEFAAKNTQGSPIDTNNCIQSLEKIIDNDDDLLNLVKKAVESAKKNQSAIEFCKEINQTKGVSGYIYHTLPVVIQIVLRHNNDFEQAITEAVACGGDTDTVAAIVGGIVGSNVGKEGIPEAWIDNLKDWPRDKRYLQNLVDELCAVKWFKKTGTTQWMDPIRLWLRNIFFMVWVLLHGFRRLLPPY